MVETRNRKSKMEKYKCEIEELLNKGITIRATWKIICSDIPSYERISYAAFLHFVNKQCKTKPKND